MKELQKSEGRRSRRGHAAIVVHRPEHGEKAHEPAPDVQGLGRAVGASTSEGVRGGEERRCSGSQSGVPFTNPNILIAPK